MKIDIIIPVYNQIKYTKLCLESLYKNTGVNDFRLIVIDNASTDGTKIYLNELRKEKENMVIVQNIKNLGWCAALNQGYECLSKDSDFVLWANNDIVFEKEWLPKMAAHFKPGVGAVGPTSNYVSGRQKAGYNACEEYEEEVSFLIGFFLMIRREVVNMLGQVDERFGLGGSEEMDYCLRMRKDFGYKCIIARDVYIHHFGSRTLKPYLGDDKEKYNQFFKNKHEILVDKWGEETVTKWLFTDLRLSDSPSQWPQGIKLGWAMPLTWPYINSGTHLSLMAMERPDFIYLEATRGGDIASKREAQIKKGMEMGCTHFFILDADMIYPPKILVDLFKLLENGADLAGGLCWRGYPPWEPVVWSKKDNYTLLPFRDFKLGEPIIDAGATGAACLLVKRRVFEALKKPWFQYKREEIIREDGTTEIDIQGEDNYFTRNATDAGFRLDIFTNYDVSHLREFEVDRNFWLMMAVMNKVIGPNNQWANVIALLKKLHEPDWFEREVNQASIDISWPIIQRHYEIGLLHNFLIGKKPKTVCEIGTKDGGTARLWESLVRPRNGMVFCIDKEFPISYLKGRTVRIKGNSHDPLTLSRLRSLNNGNKIDFLFIDGDHSFQGVKMDFEDYSPLVHPGGWIAFHDILDTEFQRSQGCEVSRFWEEIKDQYNHFEIIDPNNKNDMGIGILEWRI